MSQKLIIFALPFLFACSPGQLAREGQSSYHKIDPVERQVPVSTVRNIKGFFGHRMELNRENYIKTFPMDVQWLKREHHVEVIRDENRRLKAIETNRTPYAFLRGPLVYVLDMVWNDHIQEKNVDLSENVLINTDIDPVVVGKPSDELLGPAYQTKATYNSKEIDVILLPFTNVGHWYEKGKEKPDRTAPAYSYAIWLYDTL